MRIAHVIAYYQPDFGYQETHLAAEQKKVGHDVYVVTSDRYHPGLYRNEDRRVRPGIYSEDGVTVVRLKTAFELGTRPVIKDLETALRELNPDVIHCHDVFSFLPASVAGLSNKIGCPVVYDSHAAHFNTDSRSNALRRLAYALFRMTAGALLKKRAFRFVAVGENELEFLCAELGLKREDVDVIRMGADSGRFVFSQAERESCRGEFGIRADEVVLAHAGRISGRKSIELLMEAAARLMREGLRLKLLVAGGMDEAYGRKLTGLSRKLGLEGSIIFTGHVEKAFLPRLFCASDIAVWPGNISIGAIEAMSTRLPLVAPKDDYNKGLVKNGNGLLFPKDDMDGLADCISRLASDPRLRSWMGVRSRDLVERDFDWKAISGQFVSLYRAAAAERA